MLITSDHRSPREFSSGACIQIAGETLRKGSHQRQDQGQQVQEKDLKSDGKIVLETSILMDHKI